LNEPQTFRVDRFLSLTGQEFINYVEPFVNMQAGLMPQDVYEPLRSELARMDDAHVVYTIEICMRLNPLDFVDDAVNYLSHTDAAVCCAAYNSINSFSSTSMRHDVVAKIAATPIVDLFTNDVRTGEWIRIGTNAVFIRDLLAKFTPKADTLT